MDNDLVREVRNYFNLLERQEKNSDQRHKEMLGAINGITEAITEGFKLLTRTMLDMENQRR
jgi:hypothetical protein